MNEHAKFLQLVKENDASKSRCICICAVHKLGSEYHDKLHTSCTFVYLELMKLGHNTHWAVVTASLHVRCCVLSLCVVERTTCVHAWLLSHVHPVINTWTKKLRRVPTSETSSFKEICELRKSDITIKPSIEELLYQRWKEWLHKHGEISNRRTVTLESSQMSSSTRQSSRTIVAMHVSGWKEKRVCATYRNQHF